MVILVANYVVCLPVLIAVGVFSLFHLWSIVTNTTTIEGWEKDKVASLKRRGKIREVRFPPFLFHSAIESYLPSLSQYRYPYNLGVLPNLKAVLGKNTFLWCWPQSAPGSGLSYPTATGTSKPYYRHRRKRWFWQRWWKKEAVKERQSDQETDSSNSGSESE
jgi:hypothetical protein